MPVPTPYIRYQVERRRESPAFPRAIDHPEVFKVVIRVADYRIKDHPPEKPL